MKNSNHTPDNATMVRDEIDYQKIFAISLCYIDKTSIFAEQN